MKVLELALLDAVERRLGLIAEEVPGVADAMPAYLASGKRLRARLLIAVGVQGTRPDVDAIERYATFVELVHAGGLCHDDIVDRSPMRRGRASIARSHGVRRAAGTGLYLMARAYENVAQAEDVVRAAVARAAARVARGQAVEMTDLYRETVEVEEYLDRVSDKTAALFELAAVLGGAAGGLDAPTRSTTERYAAAVGVAFQLADDIRDIVGGVLGREVGTDIREGVYTLPVLLTLAGRYPEEARLRSALRRARRERSQASVDVCCAVLRRNGSLAAAAEIVLGRIDGARRIVSEMNPALRNALLGLLADLRLEFDAEMQSVA
jgi:geranylgeranyl pyrophosphate synthase